MNHLGDTNKMVGTPRTDGLLTEILDAFGYVHQGNCPQRWVNHSRELERELNAANQIAKKYEDRYFAALARIKRLEDLGKELRECASMIGTYHSNEIETIDQAEAAVEAWDKEAKL